MKLGDSNTVSDGETESAKRLHRYYLEWLQRATRDLLLRQTIRVALIEQRREGYIVTVTLPEKKFLVDIDRHRRIEDQCLAVSLSPLGTSVILDIPGTAVPY